MISDLKVMISISLLNNLIKTISELIRLFDLNFQP